MTEQEINNLIDSKIGKVKMSQLPEATQTSGLYSIGYNGNQSVKYKANLLQGDPLTVRKTYQTEALALADKNPIDPTTSLPLTVGQFVSIVDDGEKNGIYRISSISGDGTMSLELQGKLGDLSDYVKSKDLDLLDLSKVDVNSVNIHNPNGIQFLSSALRENGVIGSTTEAYMVVFIPLVGNKEGVIHRDSSASVDRYNGMADKNKNIIIESLTQNSFVPYVDGAEWAVFTILASRNTNTSANFGSELLPKVPYNPAMGYIEDYFVDVENVKPITVENKAINGNFNAGLSGWNIGGNVSGELVDDKIIFTGTGNVSGIANCVRYVYATDPADNYLLQIQARSDKDGAELYMKKGTNAAWESDPYQLTTEWKTYIASSSIDSTIYAFGASLGDEVEIRNLVILNTDEILLDNITLEDILKTAPEWFDNIYINYKDLYSILGNKIDEIRDEVNSIAEMGLAIINLDSTITEDGYWRYENGNRFIYPGSGGYKHTTPVAVQLGDEFITSSSVVSGATTLLSHATFDEDMNIIGALLTSGGGVVNITQELIDAGVRYVSFSYRPDDIPKTLTLTRDVDTSDMYNKIRKNESDIKNLHSRVVKLEDETPYISGIVAMGASLMYPGNVWFANAVNSLGVTPYNKAESGVGHPVYFANKLWRGTFCTDEEFENMDILAIQFANNSGLESEVGLMTNASDYTAGFDIENLDNQFSEYSSAQNLDYILKFWQIRCFEQKDNPQSKWFGTTHGKPFSVIFVTHWHDSRPYYNDAIRTVAERWGCAVCAFDKKIGFSKNQPIGETQVSVLYAQDTQEVGGVTYGWHPLRGIEGEYIQGKMAIIFADTIKEHFGLL